jgi:hypothetical protein
MFGSVSALPAQAKTFKNCADLQKVYKYGISLSVKTVNRGAGPIFTPRVSASLFKLNTRLDLDKDKIVCEVVRPKPASTAAPSPATLLDLTLTSAPHLTGVMRVGGTLTAHPEEWDSGVTLRYQWLRNGSPIAGATSRTYTAVAADLWTKISVQATGSKPGFNSAVRTSYAHGIISWGPTPGIYGIPSVGSTLDSFPGVFDVETSKRFQWLRNGSPIAGAFFSTYTLVAADGGTSITLQVTVFKPSDSSTEVRTSNEIYVPVSAGSATTPTLIPTPTPSATPTQVPTPSATPTQVPTPSATPTQVPTPSATPTQVPTPSATPTPTTPNLTLAPTPTITGTARVGNTLTANPGTWDSVVTLSYQWLRNGSAIAGGTASSYRLVSADAGTNIAIQVTGSKSGFSSAVRVSSVVSIPVPNTSTPQNLTLTPYPAIDGSAQQGKTLTAVAGTWDEGVRLSYQWFRRDGNVTTPIEGATSITLDLTRFDTYRHIKVVVTGEKAGYYRAVRESSEVLVSLQTLTLTPSPTINGSPHINSTLTAVTGSWDEGVALSYQWIRYGVLVGTEPTYRISNNDGQIFVRVTGRKTNFETVSRESATISVTNAPPTPNLALSPEPTTTGTFQVGGTVTANSGTWDSGVSLNYQWRRNGSDIAGANSSTYTLVAADGGTYISLVVTGSKAGFNSATRNSGSKFVRYIFTLTPDPTITGTARVGSTLTANPGTWDSGVTLTYFWVRNGNSIAGATSSTYTLVAEDGGKSITVQVVATKADYVSVFRSSGALSIPVG